MRKLLLVTTMIILQSFPALADEMIQLSDAQWAARVYAGQPYAYPTQGQRQSTNTTAPTAPDPDQQNNWGVMQLNFGM